MFRLRIGYLIAGIATGFILLASFLWSLPDGKLRIVFCDVGQGDSAYIRFPDGRDMLVDGGPSNRVLQCLGKHMSFWDRHINLVVMTHPQKDHMQGLGEVFERYSTDYFLRSDIDNTSEGYTKLMDIVKRKGISVKYVTQGEEVRVGGTSLTVLWPSTSQIALGKPAGEAASGDQGRVLGAAADKLNDFSIVFFLRYGSFDALFTGDADTRVEGNYRGTTLALRQSSGQADESVEVLKVPHHGSRTGMTQSFLEWLEPDLAVISVGKNSYGHPADEILGMLNDSNVKVLRTDEEGDIEIVSDGKQWAVNTTREKK